MYRLAQKTTVLVLSMAASSFAVAQQSETITAPVMSPPGATSPYARATTAPRGNVLVDEFTGRVITHPTGGFGGAPASAIQSSLGMTLFGGGAQIAANNWVGENFTVPAGGLSINRVRVYSYQTGSTTVSPFNDLRIRIMSGTPEGAVVFGDTTTNRLSSSAFTGIYRVSEAALTDSTRPMFELVADFVSPIVLTTPGTYWMMWQMGGTLASGPWAPPQVVIGQNTSGNCVQSLAGAASTPLLDGGTGTQQGCLFALEGVTVPVQLQSYSID